MLSKKNIFKIILFIMPFFILFFIEMFLRLISYGDDLSIVVEINRNGKSFYTMNQLVGKRYFNAKRLYYRKGSHDFFEVDKKPSTIRIFCFGASTTAGFPYEYNAIPSEFLRERLVTVFPKKRIEVINTAIAATSSYTVCEFVNELSEYHPDLFIVYMGQNEFYGAFGVGSSISAGKNRYIIKTYLWMQQFKTFLLLKDIINSVSNYFKTSNNDNTKLLMENMVEDNSIKYKGKDYQIAKDSFRDNYVEIIETAKANKIPIIISTLVTNEKDLKPFVSLYSEEKNDSLKNLYEEYYQKGSIFEEKKDYINAVKYFQNTLSIDSNPAEVHYKLGKCYEALKNYEKAKKEYVLAKDLDGLKFRAPSEFNQIIKGLAQKFKVPLSDVSKKFHKKSPNGIIGKELLIDHVHPNIRGYFLLAKTWFQTIKNNNLIGLNSKTVIDDNLMWQKSLFTPLDSIIGKLSIMKLKSRPPFNFKNNVFTFTPQNFNEQIAYDYILNDNFSWGEAHLRAAKKFYEDNDLVSCLKEFKAILVTDESNPDLLSMIGDIYYELKSYPEAEKSYLKALLYKRNQFIEYKLGLTNLHLRNSQTAIQYLSNSLIMNDYSMQKFTPNQIQDIHIKLALAYLDANNIEAAANELNTVLKLDPSNQEARNLLLEVQNKE